MRIRSSAVTARFREGGPGGDESGDEAADPGDDDRVGAMAVGRWSFMCPFLFGCGGGLGLAGRPGASRLCEGSWCLGVPGPVASVRSSRRSLQRAQGVSWWRRCRLYPRWAAAGVGVGAASAGVRPMAGTPQALVFSGRHGRFLSGWWVRRHGSGNPPRHRAAR